jgi:hypothetical protein
MTKKVSTAAATDDAKAPVTDQADAATVPSAEGAGPSKSDAPQLTGAAGTNSTDDTQQSDQGGAGNAAGPATADALIEAGKDASVQQMADVSDFLKDEEAKFRKTFPALAKALDQWKAGSKQPPHAVRIISTVEGFRRAGRTHGRTATDHPIESFRLPEDLEALLSEPKLAVTFV